MFWISDASKSSVHAAESPQSKVRGRQALRLVHTKSAVGHDVMRHFYLEGNPNYFYLLFAIFQLLVLKISKTIYLAGYVAIDVNS